MIRSTFALQLCTRKHQDLKQEQKRAYIHKYPYHHLSTVAHVCCWPRDISLGPHRSTGCTCGQPDSSQAPSSPLRPAPHPTRSKDKPRQLAA